MDNANINDLRDEFAGLAMQAYITNESIRKHADDVTETTEEMCSYISEASYMLANAMLKEREKHLQKNILDGGAQLNSITKEAIEEITKPNFPKDRI